ncbi:hypothetical protein COU78_06335 [Candidatus Peregrinibacteria bacterium CG10_big_fil_rev_8_21_14_0_10_49_24]|nr:MAG: hypothetical protein COV83_03165 [Candidatus Peregrinibacteria bacterium CG11_big_fil_rev_8_21_14_0_20_49_14]PIR50469.1 MAG: hypothetical protein COU78_06335 [Candidatus Peregrinibacteria bacterium CG10_big_fil_rev_8_21_14_0_10_49_24]PJA68305.1 MAG: hypothetical protein CO157_00325 [Candidatus Peregrinibacteria bacterium CG_4_9_14_3_um_filter_49_12]
MSSLLIRGGTLIHQNGESITDIYIQNGVVSLGAKEQTADREIHAEGMLIVPALIDCHVHFREPGLTHKATMLSESKAARAGGVTTVCEMPNTNPPTFTVEALTDKVRRAEQVQDCDIRFFMGATQPEHLQELRSVWTGTSEEMKHLKKRCCGLKLFLENSTGNLKIEPETVHEAFKMCSEIGCSITAHCEDPLANATAAAATTSNDVSAHDIMRPAESEAISIEYAVTLVRNFGTRFHVAHLSTALGADYVRQAKAEGLPVTCEVTPHHLYLHTGHYKELGTLVKMNPPIRSDADSAALWKAIADGTVDCIATDHAPHLLEEKRQHPPLSAPSGVPGVETMLPLLLTSAAKGIISYGDIIRLCFTNPNAIYRLGKQDITEGSSPDILIIDPSEKWIVRASELHSACGWTPFEGFAAQGRSKYVLKASEDFQLPPENPSQVV